MTTIALISGILSADTRQTQSVIVTRNGTKMLKSWHVNVMKVRATALFAVTGAGCGQAFSLMRLLPFFVLLRWFFFIPLPMFHKPLTLGTKNNLIVCWRTGSVWVVNYRLIRRFGITFAHMYQFAHAGANKTVTGIGGSGADHIPLDEAEHLTLPALYKKAAAHDTSTNTDYAAFNTKTWAFKRTPKSVGLLTPKILLRDAYFAMVGKTITAKPKPDAIFFEPLSSL